jgi:hypothetical protein
MSLKRAFIWLRYEKAWLFWILQLSSLFIVLGTAAVIFLQSAFADQMGLGRLRARGAAMKEAVYWQFRVWKNSGLPVQEATRYYGFINGAKLDGRLKITVADGEKYALRDVSLANLTNIRVDGLAAAAELRRRQEAIFDIYPGDRAVVWVDGQPWNVVLIADNLAVPTPAPPTNVVDQVFAEYFWSKARDR